MKKILLMAMLAIVCLQMNAKSYNLAFGESEFLAIPDPPNNGYVETASWDCSNSCISFSERDEVGAIVYPNHYFEGTAYVNVSYRYTYLRNGKYQMGAGSASFSITFKSQNAYLDETEVMMNVGETKTLKYHISGSTYSPYGSAKFTWKSSNEKVATVDSNGKVTAVGSGSATITFDPVVAPTLKCSVEVAYVAPKKITLTPDPLKLTVGKSKSLTVEYTPEKASAKKLTWESADKSIATVSSTGSVKAVAEGETTITVTTDNGLTAEAKVMVLPLPTDVMLPASESVQLGYSKELTATMLPEGSEANLTWKSSDTTIVTVNNNGIIKGRMVGKAVITVTTENGKKAECTVEVTDKATEVDYRVVQSRATQIENMVKKSFKIKNSK